MLIADKKKITLPIEYPKSSLIIKNPHHKLALMFQNNSKISVSNNQKDNNDDHQEVQDIGVMVKGQTFRVNDINVYPLRGILLPGGQQLISIEGIILPTMSKFKSQYRKTKPKRQNKLQQPKQSLIATISISSSYLLEMNKQHFVCIFYYHKTQKQQMIKNSQSLLPQSKIDIDKLSQIQTFMYEIYLQYKQTSSTVFWQQDCRTRHKYSLPEKIGQNLVINENKSSNNNQLLINSLNINKTGQGLQNMSMKLLQNGQQLQKIDESKQQQKNQKKDKKNEFENSKLNQDYDLIRNKTTLSHIQTKRSNQLFQIFQSSQSQIKKNNNNNNKKNNNNNKHSNNNNSENQNNNMLTKAQKSPILLSQNIINFNDNNLNTDEKLIPPPPVLNPNEKIDQSIVIQSFRHHHSKKSNKYNVEKDIVANYRSVQVLVLAIIAAIFLSLGNNLRVMMFR